MNIILFSFTIIFAVFLLAAIPQKFKAFLGFALVVMGEYVRNIASSHGFFSVSGSNYFSIAIYVSIILFYLIFTRNTLVRLFSRSFQIVSIFWIVYIFSALFSIPLYGVEINFVILVSLKVLSILCIAVHLRNLNEIYWCILITVVLGSIDLLLGFTGRLSYNIITGNRELGFIPWLREDTIWFASALLWANIVFFKLETRSPIKRYLEAIFKILLNLILIAVIVYGNVTVQIRAYLIETLLGLLVVLFITNIKRGTKILIGSIFIVGISALIWQNLSPDAQFFAVSGLLERNDGGRFELWLASIEVWSKSPIIGHGIGTDSIFLMEYNLPGRQSSHSVYFTLGIELGIVGVVTWLYINLRAIFFEIKAFKRQEGILGQKIILVILILHITMLFHVLFHGLVYFPWVITLPTLSYWTFDKVSEKGGTA